VLAYGATQRNRIVVFMMMKYYLLYQSLENKYKIKKEKRLASLCIMVIPGFGPYDEIES
jgi:hypothetical protein